MVPFATVPVPLRRAQKLPRTTVPLMAVPCTAVPFTKSDDGVRDNDRVGVAEGVGLGDVDGDTGIRCTTNVRTSNGGRPMRRSGGPLQPRWYASKPRAPPRRWLVSSPPLPRSEPGPLPASNGNDDGRAEVDGVAEGDGSDDADGTDVFEGVADVEGVAEVDGAGDVDGADEFDGTDAGTTRTVDVVVADEFAAARIASSSAAAEMKTPSSSVFCLSEPEQQQRQQG